MSSLDNGFLLKKGTLKLMCFEKCGKTQSQKDILRELLQNNCFLNKCLKNLNCICF